MRNLRIAILVFSFNQALGAPVSGHLMPHTLREAMTYDTSKMIRLVDREIDMKEADDEQYLSQVADVLAKTVLIQPQFSPREAALRELRSKIEQEEYVLVIKKAAERLLSIASTDNPADQATALVALTNLVVEMRAMKRPEFKTSLEKISHSKLEPSESAIKYMRDAGKKPVYPSIEATESLKVLKI